MNLSRIYECNQASKSDLFLKKKTSHHHKNPVKENIP